MTEINVPCCPVCGRHCGAARWRFRPNLDVVVTTLCRATPRARPQTTLMTAQYRARCEKMASRIMSGNIRAIKDKR